MPFGKVLPSPGINTEFSPTLNRGGWSASNMMRFRMGLPEKLGGWQQLFPTPVVGTGLGMHSWADLTGNDYLMIGTEQRLMVGTQGTIYDITPLRETTNNAVSFTTVSTSTLIKIADSASDTSPGDWIYLVTPVSVGGIILQGAYLVADTVDANDYHINAASPATASISNGGAVPEFTTSSSSAVVLVTFDDHGLVTGNTFIVEVSTTGHGVTLLGPYIVTVLTTNTFDITAGTTASGAGSFFENGGNARIEYLISSGFAANTPLSGYGIGDYGAGDYGLSGTDTTIGYLRQWSGDNWGQQLVCCYNGSPIFTWTPPPTGVLPGNFAGNPAQVLATGPQINTTIFVMSQAEILVAAGCEIGSVFDPLLVRWSDQGDNADWIASSSNQAGSFRLRSGSRIVGAGMIAQNGVIWTDTGLWAMQYIGYPDVFGFTQVGFNCGLIALRAWGFMNSQIFWMGVDNFYIGGPGGGVFPLPCTVWDIVFRNLDMQQLEEIFCAVNPLFNEVGWFFPSASGTGAVDTYVKYNTVEQTWDYGSLERTCWDEGLVFGAPIGCDANSYIQQHETSPDANGQILPYSFTTGYFDIAQGEQLFYVDQIIPDFVQTSASQVLITVYARDGGNSPVRIYGPYNYSLSNPQANIIPLNARGRQMALGFAGNDLGSFVRLGGVRYRFGNAGGR